MALVSEHEQTAGINDTDKDMIPEEDIVKQVKSLLSREKRARKKYDNTWKENYEFVAQGKQWSIERPKWRFSESVNITWANIMQEIAIQTDARPKFDFFSEEISDQPFTDILKQINDRNWQKYSWNEVVAGMLFHAKVKHVAHAEVSWDPDLAQGLGDVCFKPLNPTYLYWDSLADNINRGKRARHLLYAEPVPTSELQLKYPHLKDELKADVSRFSSDSFDGENHHASRDEVSIGNIPDSESNRGQDNSDSEPMTLLIKAWLRPEALEQVKLEHKEGEEELFALKKKYPTGRYIEIANNMVLFDGPPGVEINGEWVPYKKDKFPIAKLCNYSYPGEYAGENEVTHQRGPQKIVNYVWSYILDMFKMQANPKQIVGKGGNIDVNQLTNNPSQIIETNDMNAYRQEVGQAIAPGSFNLLDSSVSFQDKVQGLSDATKGAVDSSIKSGVMLEGFVEAAQTRPRLKNRNLEYFLQDAGELMLDHYMQFYTKNRVIRITNADGYPEQIEFMFDDNKVLTRSSVQDESGKISIGDSQVHELKGELDVRVATGSALPFAKAQKQKFAESAMAVGAIDAEEYLKTVDWPNKEEVIQRLKDKAEAAAQAEAQQGQPGAN